MSVPATPAEPRPSGAARLLWWCVILMPVAAGPFILLLGPLVLAALGAAFVVVVDSITDRGMPAAQRSSGLLLSAAVIPAAFLAMLITGPMMTTTGIDPRTTLERVLPLAGIPVWVLLLILLKPKIWAITKKSDWKP